MRIDIVVIITIVVTHYAEKILDIFDQKTIAVIRKRANVRETLALKNKEDYLHEIHEDNKK